MKLLNTSRLVRIKFNDFKQFFKEETQLFKAFISAKPKKIEKIS